MAGVPFLPLLLYLVILTLKLWMTTDYNKYIYELLPETYEKLSAKDSFAYEDTWNLWKEGIAKGILVPQFHGREHINLKVFEEKLIQKDQELLTALKNRSLYKYLGFRICYYKLYGGL